MILSGSFSHQEYKLLIFTSTRLSVRQYMKYFCYFYSLKYEEHSTG